MPTIEEEVEKYVEQGYFPEVVTSSSATLIKHKNFNGRWALMWYAVPSLLLFLGLLLTTDGPAGTPLATGLLVGFFTFGIYCVYFALKTHQRVRIFCNAAGDIWVREEQVQSSMFDPVNPVTDLKVDRRTGNKPRRKTSRKVRR